MPTYEYQCKVCGHQFEIVRKMSDTSSVECPACHKPEVERLLSAPNIQFKGTGWYVTDYKNKDKKKPEKDTNDTSASSDSENKTSTSSTPETKPAESKSTTEK